MKRRMWFPSLFLLSLAAVAFPWLLERRNSPSASPDLGGALPVPAPAGPACVQGVGYVEPRTEVRRLCFKADGVIGKCLVEVGAFVHKGDLLMTLGDAEQQAAVSVAEREVEVAQQERARSVLGLDSFEIASAEQKVRLMAERLRYVQGEYERHQRMLRTDSVSQADMAAARNRVAETEAGLRAAEADHLHLRNSVRAEDRGLAEVKVRLAQARLALARQRLADTALRAPFDGKVLEILKREGEAQRMIDGEPVILFADLRRLRVRAEIDERHARAVRVGQEALVFGRGLRQEAFPGKVVAVREVMGKKTVFARTAAERKDLDVLGVLIDMPEDFTAPAGLRVDVQVRAGE